MRVEAVAEVPFAGLTFSSGSRDRSLCIHGRKVACNNSFVTFQWLAMSELVTVRRCISVLGLCCIVCVGLFSAFTVNAQNPTDQEAAPPDAGRLLWMILCRPCCPIRNRFAGGFPDKLI